MCQTHTGMFKGVKSANPKTISPAASVMGYGYFWEQQIQQSCFIIHITYCIFLWVANFDPQDVVHKPVNWLVFMEHQEEFNHHTQITGAKELPYQRPTQTYTSVKL